MPNQAPTRRSSRSTGCEPGGHAPTGRDRRPSQDRKEPVTPTSRSGRMVPDIGWPPDVAGNIRSRRPPPMLRFIRRFALSAILLSLLALSASGVSAAPAAHVVGHVYVNNNSAGTNTVAGFDRWSDGNLSPIPGSPFPTGGAGFGTPTGSAGAIQMTANGKYVLA